MDSNLIEVLGWQLTNVLYDKRVGWDDLSSHKAPAFDAHVL